MRITLALYAAFVVFALSFTTVTIPTHEALAGIFTFDTTPTPTATFTPTPTPSGTFTPTPTSTG